MYGVFLQGVDPKKLAEILGRQLTIPCCAVSGDSSFLWANREFCERLGYTLAELTRAMRFDQIASGEGDLSADRELFERLKAGDETTYEVVKYVVAKQGERLHVRLTLNRIPAAGTLEMVFVQVEILGDEQREAFQFATKHVEQLTGVIDKQRLDLGTQIGTLITLIQKQIDLQQSSQWFSNLMQAVLRWLADYQKANPVWSSIIVVTLLLSIFGRPVLDNFREVAALFGVQLGSPVPQVPTLPTP